ncbi:MAG: DUF2169 family type VI secretion system accessory protein [Burkholderiales bacterium]
MLQFKNATPFAGALHLLPDAHGADALFTVVKGTFALGDRPAVAREQVPLTPTDEYYGKPGQSSIKQPSDVCLEKPATDVLLIGSAYAPGDRPATELEVSLAVGPVRKTVRVFGDRVWQRSGVGHAISPPQPFRTMPLVWERAFGGADRAGGEPRAETRNPVGTGYRAPDGEQTLDGMRLPNLEDAASLISSAKHTPPPAGFGPICAHWEPRRSYAGTYDEQWQAQRAPFLPRDFDARFFQLAPPALVASPYLTGGEAVDVRGATPAGGLQFHLPRVALRITYVLDGVPHARPANLDTVLIEPDAGRLIMVWRAVLSCDKRALRVSAVEAAVLEAA